MDTTVAVRHTAQGSRPRGRLARLATLAAAVSSAAVTVPAFAQAQPAAAAPAAAPVAAQPGRFEPASDAKGYEVFDQTQPAAAPDAARARSGFSWPTFGFTKAKPAPAADASRAAAPAAAARTREAAVPAAAAVAAPATRAAATAERQAAPAERAVAPAERAVASADPDAPATSPTPTWFADDAVSLTGWLFGHHGVSEQVINEHPGVPVMVDPCECPTWIGQIDALMLWMGNTPSRPLYLDSFTGATALDANQLMPGMSAAPRYAVIYNRDQCRSIEVNYFSIWGFEAARDVGPFIDDVGDGALEMNDLAGLNFDRIGAARAETSAHIQSFEVNLRKVEWEWVRWITGFRWVEWGQNLTMRDAVVEAEEIITRDALAVNTLNNLYGWQWGADAMLWNNGGWLRVNGIAKAGVYYNHQAVQRTEYNNFFDPPTSVAADRDTVSFFGETGITGSWAITNWLSWRAGYTLFWIEGIATPANQLSSTVVDPEQLPRAEVSPFGGVFLHGVNTGLEARW